MKHQQAGATLVELMVVIALISLIFVVSFRVLTSYLNRTSFRQGVNQFASQLNDVFNDVAVGNFEARNLDGVWCNNDNGNLYFSGRDTNQESDGIGTRQFCVFVGKAVQLGVGNGSATVVDRDNEFIVHTLIGLRDDITSTTTGQALDKFTVLENILGRDNKRAVPAGTHPNAPSFSTSVTKNIPYGLEVTAVYYKDANTPPNTYFIDGLGVMLTQFGTVSTVDNLNILGGARSINMRPVYLSANQTDATRKRATQANFIDQTSSHSTTSYYQPQVNQTIIICLASGGGDHRAYLDIGNRGGALTATAYLEGDDVSNTDCANYG